MFKARHGGTRSQRGLLTKRSAASTQAEQRIMTQGVAVIAVLVAGGDLEDALREHLVGCMFDVTRMTAVIQCCVQSCSQSDLLVDTAQQKRPKVRG